MNVNVLVGPNEPLTHSFTPLQVAMAAHIVHFNADGSEHWVEMKPVLGVMVQRFYDTGAVVSERIQMAVQYEDSGEICTVEDYMHSEGSLSYLVGIWPHKIKPEPDEEEVKHAVGAGLRLKAASDARKAKKAEKAGATR